MIADNLSGLAFEYVDPFTGVAISMGYGWIYTIYALAAFLPALAVSVRRLHDTDRSGWLLLLNLVPCVGIILLVWYCGDSTPGDNQYGPNPKGIGGLAPQTGKTEAEEYGPGPGGRSSGTRQEGLEPGGPHRAPGSGVVVAGEAGPLELVAAGAQDIAEMPVAGGKGVALELAE